MASFEEKKTASSATAQRTEAAFLLVLAMLIALACASAFAPAAAWAGSPAVVASAPENGQDSVPTSGRYWVQFENCIITEKDNADLVVLETADGKKVSKKLWSVTLPDYELEFLYRQYIYIDVDGLDAGTSYRIHVLGGVTAKNGSVNDEETYIDFTTAAKGATPAALVEATPVEGGNGNGNGGGNGSGSGNDTGAKTSDNKSGNDATTGNDDSKSDASEAQEGSGETVVIDEDGNVIEDEVEPFAVDARAVALAVAIIVVLVVALVFEVRRRKKNKTGQ